MTDNDETQPGRDEGLREQETLARTLRAIISRRLYANGAAKPDTWAAEITEDVLPLLTAERERADRLARALVEAAYQHHGPCGRCEAVKRLADAALSAAETGSAS